MYCPGVPTIFIPGTLEDIPEPKLETSSPPTIPPLPSATINVEPLAKFTVSVPVDEA